MRSNFSQPQGAPHQGVFAHAYTPTDAERLARARAWLAAGGTLVRHAYTTDDGKPGVCWWVRSPEGGCVDSLPGRIAEPLLEGLAEESRPFTRPEVTYYRLARP